MVGKQCYVVVAEACLFGSHPPLVPQVSTHNLSTFFYLVELYSNSMTMTGSSTGPEYSLVLGGGGGDGKVELVEKTTHREKKKVDPAKAAAALKYHSEAEKRRRQRINDHLSTMRTLLPSKKKMDKAAVLAEVINEIKKLEKNAREVREECPIIPSNWDEVKVERHCSSMGISEIDDDERMGCFIASLCCDYRPELMYEVRWALERLKVRVVKMEISTLEHRLKLVFVFKGCIRGGRMTNNKEREEESEVLANCVEKALNDIVYGGSSQLVGFSTSVIGEEDDWPRKKTKCVLNN